MIYGSCQKQLDGFQFTKWCDPLTGVELFIDDRRSMRLELN